MELKLKFFKSSTFCYLTLHSRTFVFATMTMMLAALLSTSAHAKSGVVFLDASNSIQQFEQTFKLIMRQIASSARRSNSYTLYFCPIGKAENSNGNACVSSKYRDRDMANRLAQRFTYNDKYTRIIRSLNSLPAATYSAASTVMIVTDLAPDHKISGKQWAFSCQDMEDLIKTGQKIEAILKQAGHEKTLIVLLDWKGKPATLLNAREKRNPSALVTTMQRRLKRKLGRKCSNPNSEDSRTNYQKAAAAMIYALQVKYKNKLSIMTMDSGQRGNRNDVGLREAACDLFKDFLQTSSWCAGDTPQKDKFTILVDLERYSNQSALKAEFRRVLKKDISGHKCAAAKKINVVFGPIDRNNPGGSSLASNRPDYLFPICQMRQGSTTGIDGCEHPNNPLVKIERAGWGGYHRLPGGQMKKIRSFAKIADGQTSAEAGLIMAKEIRTLLERDIWLNYPPQSIARTVRLFQKAPECDRHELRCPSGRQRCPEDKKTCPAHEGHSIIAQYQCGSNGATDSLETRISEVGGIVTLRIPKLARKVKIVHNYPKSATFASYDKTGVISTLPNGFARSSQDAELEIPAKLFVRKKPKIQWPSAPPPEMKSGELSIRLKSRTAATYLQTDPPITIAGNEGPVLHQLPGIYEIRFDVKDPRLQSFVQSASLWGPNCDPTIWECPADTEVKPLNIRVEEDPFVYKPPSETGGFSYQIDHNPNYLKSPKKLWPILSKYVGDSGRLTPDGGNSLRNSSNFLWALLSVTAANMDGVNLAPDTQLDAQKDTIRKLAKAVFAELFGSGGSNEEVQRMVEPAMARIGLVNINEELMPEARTLLKILLLSLDERDLCRPRTRLAHRYDLGIKRLYNEWLIQSSIEDRYRATEGGVPLQTGSAPERLSQTPFTEKLRNRCRLSAN